MDKILDSKRWGARLELNASWQIGAFNVLLFCVLLLRRSGVLTNAQFWAEDGAVFYTGQLTQGFWKSLGTPYSGYLDTVPRLIAGFLGELPARWVPAAFSAMALVVAAVCCGAFAWPTFRRLVSSDAIRMSACLAAAAAMPVGNEVVGTVCNLQWYLAVLASLIMFEVSTRGWVEWAMTGIQVAIALSAPVTLVLLPLLFWQSWKRQGRGRIRPVATIAALLVQIWLMHQSQAGGRIRFVLSSAVVAIASSGVSRSVVAPVIGSIFLTRHSTNAVVADLIYGLVLTTAMLTALWIYSSREKRRIVLASLFIGTASLGMVMVGRSLVQPFNTIDGIEHILGERYFVVPTCVFIFLAALAADRAFVGSKARWGGAVMLVLFASGMARNFAVPEFEEKSWKTSAPKVEAWREMRRRGENPGKLVVPINPRGFTMTLSQ